MATVEYTMSVPKEGKEVVDAVSAIVEHFVDKKSLAEAASLLPGVMQAVEGVGSLSAELKGSGKDELAGYLLHKVLGALDKTEAPAAE